MLPQKFEYLFLLLIYTLILLTFFLDHIAHLVKEPAYWTSALLFSSVWVGLETFGLNRALWIYNPLKVCGLSLFRLPVEEYAAFLLIHTSVAASWLAFATKELGVDDLD